MKFPMSLPRDNGSSTYRSSSMVNHRSTKHQGDLSVPIDRSPDLPGVDLLADDVTGLQHDSYTDVHSVRF